MKPDNQHLDIPSADAGLPRTLPPESYEPVRRWTLDTVHDISGLRSDLGRLLRPDDADGDGGLASTPEKVVLIASELATNALQHSRPPTDVTLLVDGTWLLDVADDDQDSAPVYAGRRPMGEGGMGLHLARMLALDVGWYTTTDRKHIWVTFPIE